MPTPPGTASSVDVRPHPSKRRALHATRPFQPGQVIHVFQQPLILHPTADHLDSVCTYCLRPGSPRACSRCHAAFYCNAACQRAGWTAIHRNECKALQRRTGSKTGADLPTPVRILLQALLEQGVERGLADLEGHAERRSNAKAWADLEMMATAACAFAGRGGDTARAIELLCKVDYTSPRRVRQEALGAYGFECRCPRCEHDLNVYQVCSQSPDIPLNTYSVMGSKASSALRDHPGAANHALVGIAARHCGELDASSTSASASAPGARPGSKHALGAQLKACKALTDHELWAISPLPQILCEVSICLAREHNYAYAVAVSALAAVACDPYRHVAPFHVVRLKNLLAVVKLLVLTAEESAALRTSPRATASSPTTGGGGLDDEARQALARIDQVSLSQMLLVMIARMEPAGCRGEWSPCVAAREMLEDIGRLDGREKELSLIDAWRHDGGSDASTRFFEYAVVEQMAALAELGRSVLREEFGV